MGLFGGKKHSCQNCKVCSRSTAGKLIHTATGMNTVGRAAWGMTGGMAMAKCGVCGHYQAEHDYRKYGGR
jgi:hypothetical protein